MDADELKRAVYAAEPAAVLVSPRIMRRLLQAQFKVPYLLVQVSHERCYFFDRQVLFSHVEQDELGLEPDRLLPPTVILLALPSAEHLETMEQDAALLRYWRLLFHVQVHLALYRRHQEGGLTAADVRSRIEKIGQAEFEEIRGVLQQEDYLLPPRNDLQVYMEFAAVYLELRYFRSNLRSTYFPAIGDFQVIDQLLAQDVDGEALFAQSRLPGAPDPVVRTDTSSDESHDYYWKLLRHAERAVGDGDIVRAAIVRTRAARVAPAALTPQTRADAFKDLQALTQQLQEALKFSAEEAQEWLQVLPALLDKADQGKWPVEAKLLYDLQKACNEHQRKLFALDLVEWALSAGKRPIKRPLTTLQVVHMTRHLRSAAQHLTMARVSDDDRQRLAKLLAIALHHCEERVRERFRPILRDALQDVGLVASSPPEQTALQKMIEELLDRITEYGFFTFSDLRDTVSRNQLKLPDLADPDSFWRGDPLLRLDRRLAVLMEGVYRRGEFYLRWLESTSSLFFGTPLGRFVTRNLAVPFGGAVALLEGVKVCLNDYVGWNPQLPWYSFVLLGVFLLGLTHIDKMRQAFVAAGKYGYQALRFAFYDGPIQLWQLPWLRRVLGSWPLLLLYWYVLKPLAVWVVLCAIWPGTFASVPMALATFFAADVLLNSRLGRSLSEAVPEALLLLYGWLRFDLLRGLIRWATYFFKRVTSTVEYVLYTVDEWLRFRSDENQLNMAMRAVLGVVWFPISYLIRLYFITLIEPSINPIKLPISSLAFKFMVLLGWYRSLLAPGTYLGWLQPHTGGILAYVIAFAVIIPTVWLLPGAFAFFLWEMKEDWRLFRANRPPRLQPVVIGRHGETMLQLLKPGFHSGTVPKLFAKLRRAETEAYRTDNWRSARTYRQALAEVARSVQVFVQREFIALLAQSQTWRRPQVRAGQVNLSCQRIRIELCHAGFPEEPVELVFEECSGWLIGSLPKLGWLQHLSSEQLQVMTAALAGLYKIAGVAVVREQLAASLAASIQDYDFAGQRLVVWIDRPGSPEIACDLGANQGQLRLRQVNGQGTDHDPVVPARHLLFSRIPLTWDQWVASWQRDQRGQGPPHPLSDSVMLLNVPRPDNPSPWKTGKVSQ